MNSVEAYMTAMLSALDIAHPSNMTDWTARRALNFPENREKLVELLKEAKLALSHQETNLMMIQSKH